MLENWEIGLFCGLANWAGATLGRRPKTSRSKFSTISRRRWFDQIRARFITSGARTTRLATERADHLAMVVGCGPNHTRGMPRLLFSERLSATI